jgi:hypothetical protein
LLKVQRPSFVPALAQDSKARDSDAIPLIVVLHIVHLQLSDCSAK